MPFIQYGHWSPRKFAINNFVIAVSCCSNYISSVITEHIRPQANILTRRTCAKAEKFAVFENSCIATTRKLILADYGALLIRRSLFMTSSTSEAYHCSVGTSTFTALLQRLTQQHFWWAGPYVRKLFMNRHCNPCDPEPRSKTQCNECKATKCFKHLNIVSISQQPNGSTTLYLPL